jgi:hypothetical protein
MRAIAVLCPHCAARLEVDETARVATCSYCGTTSRIQARTRFLERAVPPPALPPQERALPVATQRHSVRWSAAVVLLPLLVVGAALAASLAVRQAGGVGSKARLWQSPGVLVRDVTGDGVGDVIGWTQPIPGEQTALAAFDGASGRRLWQRAMGTFQETRVGFLALAGDLVLYADPRGELSALASADGATRWRATLGEQVEAFCADEGDAAVRVQTRDERWHRVDLAAGAVAAAAAPSPCRALPNDRGDRQRGPHRRHEGLLGWYSWTDDIATPRDLDGMKVGDILQLAEGGGTIWIALGHKQPGTRVPMLARYAVEGHEPALGNWRFLKSREKDAVRFPVAWTVEVPAREPLRAKEGDPKRVAVAPGRVYVGYELADGPPRVAAFDLTTGARVFDVGLPRRSSTSLDHLTVIAGRLYVRDRWALLALHPDTGAVLLTVGK